MIKLIINLLAKRGYLVLTKTAKSQVYFDQTGQKWKAFKTSK